MLDDPEELAIRLGVWLVQRENAGKPPATRIGARAVLSGIAGRTITRREMRGFARLLGLRSDVIRDERSNIVRSVYRLPVSLSRMSVLIEALVRERKEREVKD